MTKPKVKHIKIDISPEGRERLLKLADFLYFQVAESPTLYKFHMASFIGYGQATYSRVDKMQQQHFTCGMAACACGWAVLIHDKLGFDIPTYQHDEKLIDFYDVGTFLVENQGELVVNWLFSSSWSHYDNTAKGAAKRIWYLLRNGIHPDYNPDYNLDGGGSFIPCSAWSVFPRVYEKTKRPYRRPKQLIEIDYPGLKENDARQDKNSVG